MSVKSKSFTQFVQLEWPIFFVIFSCIHFRILFYFFLRKSGKKTKRDLRMSSPQAENLKIRYNEPEDFENLPIVAALTSKLGQQFRKQMESWPETRRHRSFRVSQVSIAVSIRKRNRPKLSFKKKKKKVRNPVLKSSSPKAPPSPSLLKQEFSVWDIFLTYF